MLRFENFKKEYGNFTVLAIDSFTLNNGINLLQGENGSGKTTLLKTIAGLVPFEGNIFLDKAISLKKTRRQFVQLVNCAETEPLYPGFLTAQELVKLYCYAKGGSIKQTEDLLERLHVFDAYKNHVSTYSSGMIKKLSLALAFVGKPKWILLDEPLITIDAAAVETVCNVIKESHETNHISFLITSHQSFYNSQLSFTSAFLAAEHTIKQIAL